MGPDREPEDNGLPPVDVVIPDDARELDREVQAYHRELRARHRREQWHRLTRMVQRHGTITPLVAGILLLAAIGATLLMLSTRPSATDTPDLAPRREPGTSDVPAPRSLGPPGAVGGPLPDIRVRVDGRRLPLRDLHPAVFAVVPDDCECAGRLRRLTEQSLQYGVPVYITSATAVQATRPGASEPQRLAERIEGKRGNGDGAGDNAGGSGGPQGPLVLQDPGNTLARTYDIVGTDDLAAILVTRRGEVTTVLRHLQPETSLDKQLAPLLRR